MIDIKQMIGQTLKDITASVYFYETSQKDFSVDDIIDVCLVFDDLCVTMSCNSDGESLDIRQGCLLQEVDMDNYGFVKIKNISSFLNLKKTSCIYDVRTIFNKASVLTGLILYLHEYKVIIKNSGDQIGIKLLH